MTLPPRVKPLTPDEAVPEARAIFDVFMKERGNVPNMFRTAAVRPKHLQTMIAHFRTVMNEGDVPPMLKELLAVRTSSLNECRYCLASHTMLAKRLGAQDAWLDNVRRETPADGAAGQGSLKEMPASWQAALRYAELVTQSGHAVTDADYAELARHWQPGEIVEITMVIGLFNYFNRFNDALRVQVTR